MGEPLCDEKLLAAVELLRKHGSKRKAAQAAGLDRSTFRNRIDRAAERGMMGYDPVLPGYVVKQVSSKVDGHFIKQVKAPGPKLEIPDGQIIKGISALSDGDDRVILKWTKTNEDKERTLEIMRTVADELSKKIARVKPTKPPAHTIAYLLNQFTVTDSHFGMLAWKEETGDADYDLKIAEQMHLDWFSTAIALAPNAHVGVFAQLGDLMHHDALESVTPAHRNVLDADSRLQKIIRVVIRLVRRIIAMLLEKHAYVHIVMASANHDPASSAWMRELLHSMYEDEPRLTIDNSPDVFYAYDWGNTALFYHHGHKRPVKDVDHVFAGRFRELFGRCEHSFGHVGHLHSDEAHDTNLMKVERHRTLAPRDAYASSHGWLSKRDAKIITYHKQFGEVGRITLSPQMVAAYKESVVV